MRSAARPSCKPTAATSARRCAGPPCRSMCSALNTSSNFQKLGSCCSHTCCMLDRPSTATDRVIGIVTRSAPSCRCRPARPAQHPDAAALRFETRAAQPFRQARGDRPDHEHTGADSARFHADRRTGAADGRHEPAPRAHRRYRKAAGRDAHSQAHRHRTASGARQSLSQDRLLSAQRRRPRNAASNAEGQRTQRSAEEHKALNSSAVKVSGFSRKTALRRPRPVDQPASGAG